MLHIVLVHPEIPHNTGAIGRTCVSLGFDLALIRPLGFVLDDAHLRRCGLDYWPHLAVSVYDSWTHYLETAKPSRLFFLSTKATRTLYDVRFQDGDSLVFGSESAGLPPDFYERYAASLVKIPMPGEHARSLNLSNAVAVTAYEAYRQLTAPPAAAPDGAAS